MGKQSFTSSKASPLSSMRTYKIRGGDQLLLHVEEHGNPQGPAILFLHGFSQSRLIWQQQIHSFLAKDFRLITPDLRGHGLSEKPRGVYQDSQLWADDLHAIITNLKLSSVTICAWSYAGLVVCDYLR